MSTGAKTAGAPILLVLKTPPPVGGGELRCAALRDYVRGDPRFAVMEINSAGKRKGTQVVFRFSKVFQWFRDWVRFVRLLQSRRPCLVFYPLSKFFSAFVRDSLFLWTAKGLGISFAGELAGAGFYFWGRDPATDWYGRTVLRNMSCIRVLGRSAAEGLEQHGIRNTIVSDNGVPCDCALASRPFPEDGIVRFLFVGTHSPQKGFAHLVEACVQLSRKGLDFRVCTIGEWISDAFREEMTSRLRENNLDRIFSIHGVVLGKSKSDIFAKCQTLVLPSLIEGQPLSILEAFAMGLPVIATKVGAIPQTMGDENGILITPGDVHALAGAMEQMLRDSRLRERMSRNNKELYAARYTQDRYLNMQTGWLMECARGTLNPHGQYYTAGSSER